MPLARSFKDREEALRVKTRLHEQDKPTARMINIRDGCRRLEDEYVITLGLGLYLLENGDIGRPSQES